MSDVFNEVDEELRRDKANELFMRYRPFIFAGVAAIVLGVSGYKSWEWYSSQKQARAAESYNAAVELLEADNYAAAEKAFGAFAAEAPGGYGAIALMEQASTKALAGLPAEAAALFTQAASQFADPLYQDLATLRAVLVVADDLSLADLDAKLGPLTGPGRAFRFTAREVLAAKAMEEGDATRARADYTYLSLALDAPAGARTRAGQALAVLGPEPEVVPEIIPEIVPETIPAETATENQEGAQ